MAETAVTEEIALPFVEALKAEFTRQIGAGTLRYSPTIIYPVGADEDIVTAELFCPLLPVVPFPKCTGFFVP